MLMKRCYMMESKKLHLLCEVRKKKGETRGGQNTTNSRGDDEQSCYFC